MEWLRDGALLPDNTPWMALTLGGSAFFALLELCLDIRQINQLRRDSLPRVLHDYLRPETFRQMQAWNVQRMTFLRAESTLAWMLESMILYFHLLPYFWNFSLYVLELFAPNMENRIARGLVFIFVVSFFSSLIKMPGELYRYLHIDRNLISHQASSPSTASSPSSPSPSSASSASIPQSPSSSTPQQDDRTLLTWFGDQLTMFLISLVFGVPMLGICLYLLEASLATHWILICIIIPVVGLFFSDIYPTFIAPIFNTFHPLRDPALTAAIQRLTVQYQFPLMEIVVVNGSQRVPHLNAFITGFGKRKKIVLYDTLVQHLTPAEVCAVVGHELGHHRFNHTWKQLFLQAFALGNFVFVGSRVIASRSFYTAFGFKHTDVSIGLVLFSYMYSSLSSAILIITNYISRSFEYLCDEYALRKNPDVPLASALIKLYLFNSPAMAPDPLYSAYHYSHPSLMERLERIEALQERARKEQ